MQQDKWSFKNFCYGIIYYIIGLISAPIILYFIYPMIEFVIRRFCNEEFPNFLCDRSLVSLIFFLLLLPVIIYLTSQKKFLGLTLVVLFYIGFVSGINIVSIGFFAIQ